MEIPSLPLLFFLSKFLSTEKEKRNPGRERRPSAAAVSPPTTSETFLIGAPRHLHSELTHVALRGPTVSGWVTARTPSFSFLLLKRARTSMCTQGRCRPRLACLLRPYLFAIPHQPLNSPSPPSCKVSVSPDLTYPEKMASSRGRMEHRFVVGVLSVRPNRNHHVQELRTLRLLSLLHRRQAGVLPRDGFFLSFAYGRCRFFPNFGRL